jgi:hypothetical protein
VGHLQLMKCTSVVYSVTIILLPVRSWESWTVRSLSLSLKLSHLHLIYCVVVMRTSWSSLSWGASGRSAYLIEILHIYVTRRFITVFNTSSLNYWNLSIFSDVFFVHSPALWDWAVTFLTLQMFYLYHNDFVVNVETKSTLRYQSFHVVHLSPIFCIRYRWISCYKGLVHPRVVYGGDTFLMWSTGESILNKNPRKGDLAAWGLDTGLTVCCCKPAWYKIGHSAFDVDRFLGMKIAEGHDSLKLKSSTSW